MAANEGTYPRRSAGPPGRCRSALPAYAKRRRCSTGRRSPPRRLARMASGTRGTGRRSCGRWRRRRGWWGGTWLGTGSRLCCGRCRTRRAPSWPFPLQLRVLELGSQILLVCLNTVGYAPVYCSGIRSSSRLSIIVSSRSSIIDCPEMIVCRQVPSPVIALDHGPPQPTRAAGMSQMFGTESLSGVVSALLPSVDAGAASPGRAAGSRADDSEALAALAARLRCYFVLYVVGRWDSCVRDDAGLFTLRVTPAPYGPRLCQVMLRAGRALENLEGVRARWRRLAGRGPGAGSAFLNSAAAGAGCFVGAWEGVHARRGCAERVGEALCERVSEALCERVSEALCERVVCVPAEHCRSDSPSTSGGRVPCAGRSFLGARGADRSRWWSRPRRTASAGPATASASPPAPTARGAAGPPPPRRTPLPERACWPAAIGRLRPGPGPSQGRAPRSDSGRVSRWRGSAPPPRQAAGSRPPAGSGIRRHGSGPERGPRGLQSHAAHVRRFLSACGGGDIGGGRYFSLLDAGQARAEREARGAAKRRRAGPGLA